LDKSMVLTSTGVNCMTESYCACLRQ